MYLEVDPQRKLNLPVSPQADGALDCAVDHAEGAACQSRGERLTGLQRHRSARGESAGKLRGRVGEVRQVEDIEHLRCGTRRWPTR